MLAEGEFLLLSFRVLMTPLLRYVINAATGAKLCCSAGNTQHCKPIGTEPVGAIFNLGCLSSCLMRFAL